MTSLHSSFPRLVGGRLMHVLGAVAGLGALYLSSATAGTIVKASGNGTSLNTGGAWIDGVAPGPTDIALFNSTSVTVGVSSGTNSFTTGATLNLGQLLFNLVPGANGVNTVVNIGSNPINLSGVDGVGISNAAYSGSNSGTATLQLTSPVNAVNSQIWRTLNRQLTINGAISGGSAVTITKTGNGALQLGAGNTITTNPLSGTFAVAGGPAVTTFNSRFSSLGALSLTGGTSVLAFNNTAGGFVATNLINASAPLALGGGNLTLTGKTSTAVAQTFASTALAAGSSTLLLTNQGAGSSVALNLGAITRDAGGLLSFTSSGAGTSTLTTTSGGTSGVLKSSDGVAYATVGAGTTANWAAKDASNAIVPFAGYTDISGTSLGAANASQNVNLSTTTATINATTVELGTLRFSDSTATARTVTIASGNILTAGGILSTTTQADATIASGTLTARAGSHDLVIIVTGTKQLHLATTISDNADGPVSLTTGGTGTTDIQTVNTYTGNTYVASGTHRLANSLSGNPNSTYLVGSNGTLNVNGQQVTLGGLSGNGTVTLGNTGGNMIVGGNNTDTVFEGIITSSSGQLTALTKVGAGRLTLNGSSIFGTVGNYYTGTTTVEGGALIINGSLAMAADTIVGIGGTLGGKGAISSLTAKGGSIIAPGDGGIGTLTATTLALNNGARFVFDLGGTSNAADLLNLTGALTVDATTNLYSFDFSGGAVGQTYTLLNFTSTNAAGASQFMATEGYVGTFDLTSTSLRYTLSQLPPMGAVPEPAAWQLLALGGALFLFGRRYASAKTKRTPSALEEGSTFPSPFSR